jgi:hypothetical protein
MRDTQRDQAANQSIKFEEHELKNASLQSANKDLSPLTGQ